MEKKKPTELDRAKELLQKEKDDRSKKAAEAFEKLQKELNVRFIPVVTINNQPIPVHQILNLPVGLTIQPLDTGKS